MKPIFASSKKSFACLSLRVCCLMKVPILRSKHMIFWTLLLINLSIPSNEIEAKRPFQRLGSAGWLLLYSITKGSNIGLTLLSILWPWSIDMLTFAGCLAIDRFTSAGWVVAEVWEKGSNVEKEGKSGDAPLLTEFVLLMDEGRFVWVIHKGEFTDIEVSVLVSLELIMFSSGVLG